MPQVPAVMKEKSPISHDGDCLGAPLGQQIGKLLGNSRGPTGFVRNSQPTLKPLGWDSPHEDHQVFLVSCITAKKAVEANLKVSDGGHTSILGCPIQLGRRGHKAL